jgi:hypothetical protein
VRWIAFVAFAATIALAASAVANVGHNDPHARKLEAETVVLLNRMYQDVGRAHPECASRPPVLGQTKLVHGPPDPALLRTLGVLRRPAIAGDQLPTGGACRASRVLGVS